MVGAVAARPRVDEHRLRVAGLQRRALRVELLLGAITAKSAATLDEALGELLVDGQPLHLKVGPVRTADERALAPVELEPAERVQNDVAALLGASLLVRVLDP
jgi:hypothetical protein